MAAETVASPAKPVEIQPLQRFPRPGVVGLCGHSANGKAAEAYRSFAQGRCRLGYVVLIHDPIGHDERLQYPDEKLKSRIGVGGRWTWNVTVRTKASRPRLRLGLPGGGRRAA